MDGTGAQSGLTTVTVWLQVSVLVEQSVACQVRLMICVQPVPLVLVSTTVIVTLEPQQTWEAEGASKLQAEPHWTVLLVAQVITSGVVSTVTTALPVRSPAWAMQLASVRLVTV